MKKIKLIILLPILIIILSGCLNYIELNDIGIIDVICIAKDEKNYFVSINMLNPSIKDEKKERKNYKVDAPTIEQAFDKLYLLTAKSINLSHLELLILSPNLSKNDYNSIKDFFLNRNDSRNTFSVVILENYNNDNLFKFDHKEINSLINTNHIDDGIVCTKTFDQIMEDILNLSISYIPTISISDKIEILGYRAVYSESKLLSIKESITYNFLTNKILKANLIDENLNLKIDKSVTTTSINKNNIEININSTITDYSKNKNISKTYNNLIKSYILEFLKNNNTNYFTQLIKKYNYSYYKKNKNIKPKFKVNVTSKVNEEAKENE